MLAIHRGSTMAQQNGSGGGLMLLLLVVGGLWFWLGNPQRDVAEWFYKSDAAPWETVDAFYYPDRSDLSDWREARNLTSSEECRDWVYAAAASNNDPGLQRGDYECALGKPYDYSGMAVYRATIR